MRRTAAGTDPGPRVKPTSDSSRGHETRPPVATRAAGHAEPRLRRVRGTMQAKRQGAFVGRSGAMVKRAHVRAGGNCDEFVVVGQPDDPSCWVSPDARSAACVSASSLPHLRAEAARAGLSASRARYVLRRLAQLDSGARRYLRDWAFYAGRAIAEAHPEVVEVRFMQFALRMAVELDDAECAGWVVDSMRRVQATTAYSLNSFLWCLNSTAPLDSVDVFNAMFPTLATLKLCKAVEIAVRSSNAAIPDRFFSDDVDVATIDRRGGLSWQMLPAPGTARGLQLLDAYCPRGARCKRMVTRLCKKPDADMLRLVAAPQNVTAEHFRQAARRGDVCVVEALLDKAPGVLPSGAARDMLQAAKLNAMAVPPSFTAAS